MISMVVGYRQPCIYGCGAILRAVLIPSISPDRWKYCDDFDGTPEVVTLHSCPRNPQSYEHRLGAH
jgi:hypothetical protein